MNNSVHRTVSKFTDVDAVADAFEKHHFRVFGVAPVIRTAESRFTSITGTPLEAITSLKTDYVVWAMGDSNKLTKVDLELKKKGISTKKS